MSSFSIKGISQLNLSLNIDNKKNIENIQIIINDLKELIDILSFRISDVASTSLQNDIQQQQELIEQIDTIVYDGTIPDFSGGTGGGGTGGGGTGGGTGTGGGATEEEVVEVETTAVVGYI